MNNRNAIHNDACQKYENEFLSGKRYDKNPRSGVDFVVYDEGTNPNYYTIKATASDGFSAATLSVWKFALENCDNFFFVIAKKSEEENEEGTFSFKQLTPEEYRRLATGHDGRIITDNSDQNLKRALNSKSRGFTLKKIERLTSDLRKTNNDTKTNNKSSRK